MSSPGWVTLSAWDVSSAAQTNPVQSPSATSGGQGQ